MHIQEFREVKFCQLQSSNLMLMLVVCTQGLPQPCLKVQMSYVNLVSPQHICMAYFTITTGMCERKIRAYQDDARKRRLLV